MPKTPQVPAPWKTGIYIGDGVVAEPKTEDKPEPGKQYSLAAKARGKTWAEAEIKETANA